jgi:hypothetical protein
MLPFLPLTNQVETVAVLRKAAKAHQALAELKGSSTVFPTNIFYWKLTGQQPEVKLLMHGAYVNCSILPR